jgi:hypothetical protein
VKVVVYSIALDEEKHVERWAESARDADGIVLVDTGSSDGTVAEAERIGIAVHRISVSPWRFDDARNAALALLPEDADICVALDLDEMLLPGWREVLEAEAEKGATIFSAAVDAGTRYTVPRAHRRHGVRWLYPCHEVISASSGFPDVRSTETFGIRHAPDDGKSRAGYLELLERMRDEMPDLPRAASYLGREYTYHGRDADAAAELKRHLSLPASDWRDERSQSMCLLSRADPGSAEEWALKACAEAPWRREVWMALADVYYKQERWAGLLMAAERALGIRTMPMQYFNEPYSWGPQPYDYAAIAAWHLGMHTHAVLRGEEAVAAGGGDRIRNNLEHYRRALPGGTGGRDEEDRG